VVTIRAMRVVIETRFELARHMLLTWAHLVAIAAAAAAETFPTMANRLTFDRS
jgi:hypothetical protein